MVSKLLSDTDVKKLIGKCSKLITYPELSHYSSIDDLFKDCNKIILLYVNEIKDNAVNGHWCLLTRVKRNGKTIVEFNDPYGYMPDDQLNFYSDKWRRESGQNYKYLTKLLYDFSLNPNNEVHYNELQLQKESPDVNTCGRWAAIRGYFYRIPLKTFQKRFEDLREKGFDLDKVAVYLTNQMFNHSM